MKDIRLKYHRDTGTRISPEINLIQDYVEEDMDGNWKHPFPNLYDYIIWLEDQIEKPIGVQMINTAEAGKRLKLVLQKLQ